VANGSLSPFGSAWAPGVAWGAAYGANGDNVVWGTITAGSDNVVWGTFTNGDNVVWGTVAEGDNVVWGTTCGGDDCFNVVWGTNCEAGDCYNVVWGTIADGDNVVWGTFDPGEGDNVVWGTAADNGDNVVWGTSTGSFIDLYVAIYGQIADEFGWRALFQPPATLDAAYAALFQFYQQWLQRSDLPPASALPLNLSAVNQTTAGGL
jgi:hypothetical protein